MKGASTIETSFSANALTYLACSSWHNFPTYKPVGQAKTLSAALQLSATNHPKKYSIGFRGAIQAPQIILRLIDAIFITTIIAPFGCFMASLYRCHI